MVSIPPPPPLNGKRKRDEDGESEAVDSLRTVTLQIVTGSYERVLHGIVATIPENILHSPDSEDQNVSFADTFLFNAHASSIRCLALSPLAEVPKGQPQKRLLATGSSDERINLYQLSTVAMLPSRGPLTSSLVPVKTTQAQQHEQIKNREVGSLMHHSSTVTGLYFPSRGKLLSSSIDNTLTFTRVRDWTVLSTIRAPVPKPSGRPSGDTAAPGEVPAGINDFAVHPSAKLCITVGQGERCMRLWNLVTAKKAGVLTFDKGALAAVGETRWRGGEGRRVVWSEDGEEFAVGFERGALIYGLDCEIKGVAAVGSAKVCQLKYIPFREQSTTEHEESSPGGPKLLAISTEDGRILIYDTKLGALEATTASPTAFQSENNSLNGDSKSKPPIRRYEATAAIGSSTRANRIKDFEIFRFTGAPGVLIVTGNSNGVIRVWAINDNELIQTNHSNEAANGAEEYRAEILAVRTGDATGPIKEGKSSMRQIGRLLGMYETGKRITCLTGFRMSNPLLRGTEDADGVGVDEWHGIDGESGSESDGNQEDSDD